MIYARMVATVVVAMLSSLCNGQKKIPQQHTHGIEPSQNDLSQFLETPQCLGCDVMCLFYLCFFAGLQTSLFSLETASVLSHSNLKIEMSLLGSIAVMAATSFGLFNCAVNIWRWEIFLFLSAQFLSIEG